MHSSTPCLKLLLQDARPSDDSWPALYEEAVLLIRRLYQECRLIHADLSEYNLLVHEVGTVTPISSAQLGFTPA